MTDLHALVYVSRAAHVLSLSELDRLLVRAQARNRESGVTGVLLYSNLQFMQYLEGPGEAMAKIYGIIKADRQHHGIIELQRERIFVREFPEWSMAFRSTQLWQSPADAPATGASLAAVGLSRAELYDVLQLPGPPSSIARTVLTKFWNRARLPAEF